MQRAKLVWIVLGGVLVALSVAALTIAWPVLFPQAVVALAADPDCDLRSGPCGLPLPSGGKVELSIEPRTLPLMQPLTLTVQTQQVEVRNVEVDFSGIGMNMGFNRPKLTPFGKGAFRGETRLPVCIRQAMEWEARVLLQTDKGLISAPFRFITVKQGALGGGNG